MVVGGATFLAASWRVVEFADSPTDDDVQEWLDLGMRGGWNMTLDRLAPFLATLSA